MNVVICKTLISLLCVGFTPHGGWIINDSAAVPKAVKRCSKAWRRGVSVFQTFDFSTMYTTLPLPDMKLRLRKLVETIFERRLSVSRARFLLVRRDGSSEWINSRRTVDADKEIIYSKFSSIRI